MISLHSYTPLTSFGPYYDFDSDLLDCRSSDSFSLSQAPGYTLSSADSDFDRHSSGSYVSSAADSCSDSACSSSAYMTYYHRTGPCIPHLHLHARRVPHLRTALADYAHL